MDLKIIMRAEAVPCDCESLTSLDKAAENDKTCVVASEQTAPLGPITPKGDASFSHAVNNSPRTPEVDVFDTCAPGSDKLAFAPFCNKYSAEARRNAARKLNFDAPVPFCSYITCGSGDMHLDASFADANNSPRTPQEHVFDPFAPGPDQCGAFAPLSKNYLAN